MSLLFAPTPTILEVGVPSFLGSRFFPRMSHRHWEELSSHWPALFVDSARSLQNFQPRAEANETDTSYNLIVEVPGVSQKDINISFDRGVLEIKGKSRSSFMKGGVTATSGVSDSATPSNRSQSLSTFKLSYQLGSHTIDQDNIQAKLENGLLEITIPKITLPEPKPVSIVINNTIRNGGDAMCTGSGNTPTLTPTKTTDTMTVPVHTQEK